MKHFIKGMTLLLAGVIVMACSKDVAFDENAQKEAQQAKAQAELAQKYATYQADFVKTFGSIAPGHQWGFDQTMGSGVTRTAFGGSSDQNYSCGYKVPESITKWKNGNCANTCASNIKNGVNIDQLKTYKDFDFNNYWMLHFNTAEGEHSGMIQVQAYDCNANNGQGGWIDVTNFKNGKNEEETYFDVNTSVHGAALMTNMDKDNKIKQGDPAQGPSNGKMFRWIDASGNAHYDYKFLEYSYKQGNQRFNALVLGLKCVNNWWLIVLRQAEPKPRTVVEEGRILCEDMGANDFDFNDVVFDAVRYDNGDIDIEVLAHGGILPISIDGVNVTLGNMTNTDLNNMVETQKFTISGTNGQPKYTSIKQIPIVVGGNSNDSKAYYSLEATIGSAPQIVCAPVNTDWPDEYVAINKAYPNFTKWVNSNKPDKWTKSKVAKYVDLDLSNND